MHDVCTKFSNDSEAMYKYMQKNSGGKNVAKTWVKVIQELSITSFLNLF